MRLERRLIVAFEGRRAEHAESQRRSDTRLDRAPTVIIPSAILSHFRKAAVIP